LQTVIITWCMRMSVLFWTFHENLRSFPHDSFPLFSVCSLNVGRLFQLNRPLLMFCYAFCIQSFRGRSVFFLLLGENHEIAAVAGMSPHVPTPAQLSCIDDVFQLLLCVHSAALSLEMNAVSLLL